MRDARRRGPKIRTDWTWGENRQWGDASTEEENDDTPMGRLLQEQEVSRRRAISANNAADFFDAPEVPDNNTAGAARASTDAGTSVAVERPRDPANFMFPPRSRNSDANDSHRSEQPVDRDPAYQRPTGESDVVGGGTLDRAFKTYFKTEECTDAIQKMDSDEDSADSEDDAEDDVVPNVRQEEDFAPAFAGDEGWGGAEDIRGLPRLVPPPPPLLDGLMFALAFLDPPRRCCCAGRERVHGAAGPEGTGAGLAPQAEHGPTNTISVHRPGAGCGCGRLGVSTRLHIGTARQRDARERNREGADREGRHGNGSAAAAGAQGGEEADQGEARCDRQSGPAQESGGEEGGQEGGGEGRDEY